MADEEEKKNFEFKKMLLKVSDRLSSENLQDIKMLVRDQVPTVQLDKWNKGTDAFLYFEQRGFINKQKLGYLKDIFDTINRQDLCEMLQTFEDGGMTPTSHVIHTEMDLTPLLLGEISKEVGKDWKMLSRHLGLSEVDIQAINQAYMFDLHEASLQSLLRWKEKFGTEATVQKLRRALLDMKLRGIAQKYFEGR